MWGSGKSAHLANPDMPWNEEIRIVGTIGTPGGQPADPRPHVADPSELDVRAVLPTVRVPTLVVHHSDDVRVPPAKGKYIAEHVPDANL